MVITIPENFSKNATTVLNKKPKKMELTYKTNDSLNYIGAVISKQGATKVDASVKESVSEAYADTMFKVIKKVGGGSRRLQMVPRSFQTVRRHCLTDSILILRALIRSTKAS